MRRLPSPGTVPAPLLVLGGIFSVQFGATLAVLLIPRVGVGGSVLLRLSLATAVLLLIARPRLRGWSRRAVATVVPFGVVLGLMNTFFYATLAHLPIGVAVTVEFIGPLGLAAALSHRLRDGAAVLAAATGIVLISRALEVPLDQLSWTGLGLGLLTGACWAAYIVLSRRTGAEFPALEGLTIAMAVATIVALPLGLGSVSRWGWDDVALGLGVALLSSVLPYSLELLALRRLRAEVFGILMSLEPAVAALAGLLVLGQWLSPVQLVGMALVVLASALVLGVGRRGSPSEPRDPVEAAS